MILLTNLRNSVGVLQKFNQASSMFKRLIYPLIFALLAVLSAILTSGYAFPVIPGWRYGIGDHIFKAVLVLELLLVLTAAGYGLLAAKKRRINLILFFISAFRYDTRLNSTTGFIMAVSCLHHQ